MFQIAKVAQLVEHDLAKVGVAGSSPVFRSLYVFCPDGGMVDTKDLKSFGFTAVRVQVPLRVRLMKEKPLTITRLQGVFCFWQHFFNKKRLVSKVKLYLMRHPSYGDSRPTIDE